MHRSALTLTALLLMAIFLPKATEASENDVLLQLKNLPANMTSAVTSSCKAAQDNPLTALTAFVQEPQSLAAGTCGTCGLDPCRGVPRGTTCGRDGDVVKRCQILTSERCPGENLPVCYCYSGPIP